MPSKVFVSPYDYSRRELSIPDSYRVSDNAHAKHFMYQGFSPTGKMFGHAIPGSSHPANHRPSLCEIRFRIYLCGEARGTAENRANRLDVVLLPQFRSGIVSELVRGPDRDVSSIAGIVDCSAVAGHRFKQSNSKESVRLHLSPLRGESG